MEKEPNKKIPLMEHKPRKIPLFQIGGILIVLAGCVIAAQWFSVSRDPAVNEKKLALEKAADDLCRNKPSCRRRIFEKGEDCFEQNYNRSSGSVWYKMLNREGFLKCLEKQVNNV